MEGVREIVFSPSSSAGNFFSLMDLLEYRKEVVKVGTMQRSPRTFLGLTRL